MRFLSREHVMERKTSSKKAGRRASIPGAGSSPQMEQLLKASPVRFSAARQGYVHRGMPQCGLRGMSNFLADCFWDTFAYKADREASAASSDKTNSSQGRKRGSRIDDEFAAIIAGKPPKKIHPFVKRGWARLVKQQYIPLAAQVGVASMDKRLRLGTAADMVCQFKNRPGAVVVEVKTSKSHYFKQGSGKLNWPYQKYTNSPFNQAQMQLGWTCYLFRKQFPGIPLRGAFVMRLHKGGVATYPLRTWVLNKDNRKRALAVMHAKRRSAGTKLRRPVAFKRSRTRWMKRR